MANEHWHIHFCPICDADLGTSQLCPERNDHEVDPCPDCLAEHLQDIAAAGREDAEVLN